MAHLMLVRAIQNDEPLERIRELADEAVEEKSLNRRNNEGQNDRGVSALEEALWQLEDAEGEEVEKVHAIIHLLLERGATASALDVDHITIVAKHGDPDLFRQLIQHGMKIDVQQNAHFGHTALMDCLNSYGELIADENLASAEKYERAIRMLLENGAEVELADKHGYNALHFAINTPTEFIMSILPRIITPNTINQPDNGGRTPLMEYANRHLFQLEVDEVGPDEVIPFLIQHGANVLERDNQGRTARDLAVARNNEELAEILQEKERNARQNLQGALVQRGRQGEQHRVPPGMARRITNFLGGKRQKRRTIRKGKKARKTRKGRKGRKTRHRR